MSDRDFQVFTFQEIKDDIVYEINSQQNNAAFPAKKRLTSLDSEASIIGVIIRSFAAVVANYWTWLKEITDGFYISTATGERLKRRFADFAFTMKTGLPAQGTVQVVKPVGSTFAGVVDVGEVLYYTGTNGQVEFTVTSRSQNFVNNSSANSQTSDVSSISIKATKNGSLNLAVNTQLYPKNSALSSLKFLVGTGMNTTYTIATGDTLTDGVNDETDDEAKVRFQTYIQNLGDGTAKAIEDACMNVSGVTAATVYDQSRLTAGAIDGPGTTGNVFPGRIVVQIQPTEPSEILSDKLVYLVKAAINGVKAAGIYFDLTTVPGLVLTVEISITTKLTVPSTDWDSFTSKISEKINAEFTSLGIGDSVYPSAILASLMAIDASKALAMNIVFKDSTTGAVIQPNSSGAIAPAANQLLILQANPTYTKVSP